MDAVEYEGFTIFPKTHQLRESLRWTLEVQIMRRENVQFLSAGNTFETEAEARSEAARFGRRIIDGNVPGLSVDEIARP